MTAHIRIENDSLIGNQTRIVHVAADGTETDISNFCTDVRIHMGFKEVNSATVEMINIKCNVVADLVEVAVSDLKPARLSWLRRLRDVTTFSRDGSRRFVRA